MGRIFSFIAMALLVCVAPAWATYPTIVGSCIGNDTTSDTSHVIDIGCGPGMGGTGTFGTIVAGDELQVFWKGSAVDTVPNFACSGWTTMFDQPDGASVGHLAGARRTADGNEGSTVTCATDLSEVGSFIAIRIQGHHATTPPEDATALDAGLGHADPPNLTPSGWTSASEDTLWIAIGGCESTTCDFSAYPYAANNLKGTQSSQNRVALATRELNAASENPGAFTQSPTSRWSAATVAVRPAVATGGGATGWPAPSQMLLRSQ